VGDLDGDGRPEVVVANGGDNAAQVLHNNGSGALTSVTPQDIYGTGQFPTAVVLADLNNDGKLDVIVANDSDKTVSILLGNGDGTLQTQLTYFLVSYPYSLSVADVNGDGKNDLLVSIPGTYSLAVLFGNGDGTFQSEVLFENGASYASAVGDLNGDCLRMWSR
jgi:hypothetical protein